MFSKASLEMLDTVARLGSFTAAAEVLHKVPSAISYGVRQVEQDLDVVLFRRLPRKVELTPAGELFMAEARSLLRQMEEVKAQTRRVSRFSPKSLLASSPRFVWMTHRTYCQNDTQVTMPSSVVYYCPIGTVRLNV